MGCGASSHSPPQTGTQLKQETSTTTTRTPEPISTPEDSSAPYAVEESLRGADESDDEQAQAAAELAGAFGATVAPKMELPETEAAENKPHFRKRRLSREYVTLDALTAQSQLSEATLFTGPALGGAHSASSAAASTNSPVPINSAMAASAAKAATAAVMADGKVLIVAREMEDTKEDGSFNNSFNNSSQPSFSNNGDIRKKALRSLTSGEHVGSFSCHGIEPSDDNANGVAKVNQDAACIAHPVNGDSQAALFCVYDGHGEQGTEVSTQVLQSVRHALTEEAGASILGFGAKAAAAAAFGAGTASLRDDPAAALVAAFEAVQTQLEAVAAEPNPSVDARESGSTATVAYLREYMLWVAGAGDSTCVLGTTDDAGQPLAKALTTDHKVDLPGERARIEAFGGQVRPAVYEDGELVAPARMFEDLHDKKKGPGLAVSRGIGDLNAMKVGLIPTPEVQKHKVDPAKDRFLIVASDGVWEFITPQEAVELVAPFYQAGHRAFDASKWLIANAAARWRQHEGDYRDDITAIVLWLPAVCSALAKAKAPGDGVLNRMDTQTRMQVRRMSAAFS